MAEDLIRYDILTQEALRGVVRKVLTEVAQTGLPGEHHFYISFDTTAPGVRISTALLEKYPQEVTIVVQHEFWDLKVSEHSFEIGLSFGGVPERLLVPFAALKGFVDPSVQFGLQFAPSEGQKAADSQDKEPETDEVRKDKVQKDKERKDAPPAPTPLVVARPEAETAPEAESTETEADSAAEPEEQGEETHQADVVSLDAFRKK